MLSWSPRRQSATWFDSKTVWFAIAMAHPMHASSYLHAVLDKLCAIWSENTSTAHAGFQREPQVNE